MKFYILIPGRHPEASKPVFSTIKKVLEGNNTIELAEAHKSLLQHLPKCEIIIIGKSLGGRLALEFQVKTNSAKALILLAPAVQPDSKFTQITCPTLIIHGTADQTVPIKNSMLLSKILKTCKLIEIEGADHGYEGKENEVADAIKKWIAENSL